MKEHVDIVSWSKGRDPSERINALEAQEVSVVVLYFLYKRCRLGLKLGRTFEACRWRRTLEQGRIEGSSTASSSPYRHTLCISESLELLKLSEVPGQNSTRCQFRDLERRGGEAGCLQRFGSRVFRLAPPVLSVSLRPLLE